MPITVAQAATDQEIIDAFKSDTAVQEAALRMRNVVSGNPEEAQVVRLSSGCGVVGCSFTSLVMLRITREGTNPSTGTVMAIVAGMNGKIEKVELVQLTPIGPSDGRSPAAPGTKGTP